MAPLRQMPSLADILSDIAPYPWTLSAFTIYLAQHFCLENLQFVDEASIYKASYKRWTADGSQSLCDKLCAQWEALLNTYIVATGPRGINLPCDIRDSLLSLAYSSAPPHPSELGPAVKVIRELMEESILAGFL